jgi:hypothetical protein
MGVVFDDVGIWAALALIICVVLIYDAYKRRRMQ